MDEAVLGIGGDRGVARLDNGGGASRGGPRLVPALLVVLLVAALCPLLPASPAGAASVSVQLPERFSPKFINNEGAVVGIDYDGLGQGQVAAVWENGVLSPLPGGSAVSVLDFNDAGEALVRAVGQDLEVRSFGGGVQLLPNPVIDETSTVINFGWGPTASGRVVGNFGFDPATGTSAVEYVGASGPQLITKLATVFGMNRSGQIFGTLPADSPLFDPPPLPGTSPVGYGILENGEVRKVDGFTGVSAAGYVTPSAFGDGGHVLYRGTGGAYLWKDGVSESLGNVWPVGVNVGGVVALTSYESGVADAMLRFPEGQVLSLNELVEPPDGYRFTDAMAINDDCTVVAAAYNSDAKVGGAFVVEVPDCEPIDIDGDFFRVDGGSSFVKIDEDAAVRLRVENSTGEELTDVKITETAVDSDEFAEGEDSPGSAELVEVDDAPLSATTLTASGPESVAFADFELTGIEVGKVTLRAEVSAVKDGEAVTGTIEREFQVRQDDLVVNLDLDPPEAEEEEDGTFEPVDITATVSFTNETEEDMTDIRLQELEVDRVFAGQELYVTYTSGIQPHPIDPQVIVPLLRAGETSQEFTAVFTATENGEVEFSALATAASEGKTVTGHTTETWKAKVKKYVEIKTTVVNPGSGGLLDAGGQVIIDGTVENLSNSHDITLGPLYPTLVGNTGTMNVAYDGPAANPTSPVPVESMVLEPGERRTFQVRITTNYSDPRMYEAQPSGGTRAYATFEPWGEAIERLDPDLDGGEPREPEKVDIRTYDEASPGDGSAPGDEPDAQVKADPADLFKRISIDDSIEIPDKNPAGIAAGIMLGALEGSVNAAIAVIYSIPDLIKMPYTILVAAYDYQTKVWESFTDEEKELFLTETSFLIVSVLQRNVEFGLKDSQQLYHDVYKLAGDHLTETQNDWATGDYIKTTQSYTAFLSETIGSVAGPVILSKMAKSPKAVAALERYQLAINARMAATFASAKNLKYVDNVLPVLQSIENGAEPTLTAIAKLWGVTPEEIAEYKRICGIIGCLATIRSRHTSSAQWIKQWGALLKPENLKIKSVSELDVLLGYDVNDLGSVIFRKPEILKTLGSGATKEAIKAEARSFAVSKGFKAGSKEYTEAVKRLEDRVGEWNKYQKTYKQWNDRGWIDTTFNYEGNAIPEYRFDADGNIIGKLTGADTGNFKGFRMVEKSPGSDEFVVQMLDGKTGKWRRVTGDIDPVDFTYTDGSPLSPEDHARLMQLLQDSPIGAEHGYTATFKGFMDPETGEIIVKPGPELVKKQFKPNEPALQIAPGDAAPRATRIDIENSRWVDAYDYNMRWVNGFVDAGTKRARGTPAAVDANFDVIPHDAPAQIALPVKTKVPEPTVGRFIIENGNKGDSAALIMGENGLLQNVLPDGTTQDSPLHDEAFSEGPTETITIAPVSSLQNDPAPEPALFDLFGFGGGGTAPAQAASAAAAAVSSVSRVAQETIRLSAASLDAGSDTIRVSDSPGLAAGATGFEVGQELAIGTGGDNMELRKVDAITDGVLTLTEPLEFTHEPGEVVVMVVSAAGVPVDPTKGVDPAPDPDPDPDPDTDPGTNPSTGGDSGADGTDGGTGTDGSPTPAGTDGSGGTATPTATGSGSESAGGSSNSSGSVSSTGGSSGGQPLAYTGSNPLVLVLFALFAIVLGALVNRRGWHRLGTTGGGRKV